MTLLEALTFSVSGVAIVFGALALLMCMLLLWGKIAQKIDGAAVQQEAPAVSAVSAAAPTADDEVIDPKIRAIIMAAVAADLRRTPESLNFISIKKA